MSEPDYIEAGRLLFAGPCEFIWGASKIDGLPPATLPEIAIAGRSNVGKSSLDQRADRTQDAGAHVAHARAARRNSISSRWVELRLVDMPGWGYAAVGKEKVASWTELLKSYLRGRSVLLRVLVLVDGRHGLKPVDLEMLDLLRQVRRLLRGRAHQKGSGHGRGRGTAAHRNTRCARSAPGRLSGNPVYLGPYVARACRTCAPPSRGSSPSAGARIERLALSACLGPAT